MDRLQWFMQAVPGQVTALSHASQAGPVSGRPSRPDTHAPWVLRWSFLFVLVASCAPTPPKKLIPHLTEYGAHAIELSSIGKLRFARLSSFLTGPLETRGLASTRIAVNNRQSDIRVTALGSNAAVTDLARSTATRLLTLRDALNAVQPFAIDDVRLRITLVPSGYRYVKASTSLFYGNDISATLAVRAGNNAEVSTRLAIRDIAHELIHAVFAMNGVTSKQQQSDGGSLEEEAIYIAESCVELRVFGSTSGDPLAAQTRGFATSHLPASLAVTSLNSGQRADAALAHLFAEDPAPIVNGEPRAKMLDLICREAIGRVMRAQPHG